MANNWMYLLHVPSGHYVPLGKRMGWGWYGVPEKIKERIEKLFELVEHCVEEVDEFDEKISAENYQDYFVVAFEGDNRLITNVVAHHE